MSKILLILFILLFIPSVSAVDNYFVNGTCLYRSNDAGAYIFDITNHSSAGASYQPGFMATYALTGGYFTDANTRINNGAGLLCVRTDPYTLGTLTGQHRILGTDNAGNFFYSDRTITDSSLGCYNPVSNPSGQKICVTGMSATSKDRKIAIDDSGNAYIADGATIKKFIKSLDYTAQTWYTIVSGTDYGTPTCGGPTVDITDLDMDVNNNLYITTSIYCSGAIGNAHLSVSKVNSGGSHVSTITMETQALGGGQGFFNGSIVLDNVNPTQNFTYAYYVNNASAGTYIKHNSSAGTVDVAGGAVPGVGFMSAMEYYNYQIYISFPSVNIIRSFVTNFVGYTPSGVSSGTPASLTYQVSTITSPQTTYANNSNILINNNVVVGPLTILEDVYFRPSTNFRFKTEFNDPNGLLIAYHFSDPCTSYNVGLSIYCSMNETFAITPPVTNWTAGTYTAYLKEYNINTYALATLDSITITVLNQSANTTGVKVEIPITSGTGFSALSTIDTWTAMFGLGVNPISKFMFSMMWIVFFMTVGAILLKGMSGGIIFGLFPYSFFIFIEYLPSWTVIILGIVVAIKLNIFR